MLYVVLYVCVYERERERNRERERERERERAREREKSLVVRTPSRHHAVCREGESERERKEIGSERERDTMLYAVLYVCVYERER